MNPKQLEQVLDTLLLPEEELKSRRAINRAAREWIGTKQSIGQLSETLRRLSEREKELAAELLPIVQELEDQKLRVDRVVIALKEYSVAAYKKPFEKALKLLSSISDEMRRKAQRLRRETSAIGTKLKIERGILDWLKAFAKRAWDVLRGTERKIADLEKEVYYE